MKIKKITNNILLVVSKNQYDLASTFMRIQEYYESPYNNIYNKHFTLETFLDTYVKPNGKLTYFSDYCGFNVPGNIVNKFFKIFKNDLLEKEKSLLKAIRKNYKNKDDNFYVIGCYRSNELTHEIAHALYYLHRDYKSNMLKAAKRFRRIKSFSKELLDMGYRKSVLNDEIHAYNLHFKPFKSIFKYYKDKLKIKITL